MPKLNDASLATVSASVPFDPLPENYKGEKLELRIVFRYTYLPDAPFKELYESAQRAVANQNYTSAAQLLETHQSSRKRMLGVLQPRAWLQEYLVHRRRRKSPASPDDESAQGTRHL
jgi:hypothetical protein